MQRIVMFTSSAMLVILAFFMLRLTLDKSSFSAGLPSKKGQTCYAVKGSPTNNVYQGSKLLSGAEVHFVEAWNTPSFKEGQQLLVIKRTALNNTDISRPQQTIQIRAVRFITETISGNCDPGQKVTIKQYSVASKFEPVEHQLLFRVYESGTLAHEEVWKIPDDVKRNYRLSAYSNQKLASNDPEVEVPSLGEIATNQR